MRRISPLLILFAGLQSNVHAEGMLPTAQELIAVVEIGGAQCMKLNLATQESQAVVRQYVAGLLKKRTYEQYLASTEYETAKSKAVEDIQKNGFSNRLCSWLQRLPSLPPGEVMFFEPGK